MRILLLIPFVLLAAQAAPARAGEEGEDVSGALPWQWDADTVFLRRIVAGATGAPVAGANVKLFAEVPHPEPGFGVPSATAVSGADGWVRIRRAQLAAERTQVYGEPSWAYVEAAGLGPDAEFRSFVDGKDWPLRPAAELRVTLHDPLDRPVVGARVGWLLGCGHTPDVRQALTDEHGVAQLVGVQDQGLGQIWFVKEGFVSRYLTDQAWRPGAPERIARVEWGPVVEGSVLRHDGTPAAGVAVGRSDNHRGPWTRTDAQGRFRLVGLGTEPGDSFFVEPDEYAVTSQAAGGTQVEVVVPPPGHDAVARLPAPGAEPAREKADVRLVVELTWQEDARGSQFPREVLALRAADGWTTSGPANEAGIALLWVRPGTYTIHARFGDSMSFARPIPGPTLEAPRGVPGVYATMALPDPETLVFRFDRGPDDDDAAQVAGDVHASLLAVGESVSVFQDTDLPTRRVPLWPKRDSFLRVDHGPRTRITPIDPTQFVVVAPAPTVHVRARLLDPEGKPVRGWLFDEDLTTGTGLRTPDPTRDGPAVEDPVLVTLAGARVRLVAWPADLKSYQAVRLPLRDLAPPAEDAVVAPLDIGEVRIPARAPGIRVEDHEGRPLADVAALVSRGMRQAELSADDDAPGALLDPWFEPGLLTTGAVVRVTDWRSTPTSSPPPDVDRVTIPFVRRLEGPGPWRLRPPTGALSFELLPAQGGSLADLRVRFDGAEAYVASAAADIRRFALVGVEAGAHEFVVEAKGHLPRRFPVTLAEGETRTIHARLTAAPEGR